jgi:hypothetical protein
MFWIGQQCIRRRLKEQELSKKTSLAAHNGKTVFVSLTNSSAVNLNLLQEGSAYEMQNCGKSPSYRM